MKGLDIKEKRRIIFGIKRRFRSVVQPGLEPGQTGPESVVLPLHH